MVLLSAPPNGPKDPAVDVAAPSPESLEAACEQVLQAAANAHLELRRLDFRHAEAIVCALPLGRGPLRGGR